MNTVLLLSKPDELPKMKQDTIGRPMEILLVEDVLSSARLTIGALKKSPVQHRMTWLNDGTEAINFLHRKGKYSHAPHPDLILLDLGLPGCNGKEILADVRADDELKKIPVVILTASTAEEDHDETEKLQVQGYLTKPVNLERFLGLVKELKQYWKEDMVLPS